MLQNNEGGLDIFCESLTPLAVDNGQDTLGEGYFTPIVVGEPLTPLAVHNHQDKIYEGYFTPHDLQDGSFQPTPKGSKFWVPKVNNKPVEGTVFDTLELALKAYKDYAREGGFEVRKGGQKNSKDNKEEPNHKYFYCVRQGFKPPPKIDNSKTVKSVSTNPLGVTKVIKRRKRASCRCGCTAQLRLKKTPDGKSWKVMKEIYGGFENIGATDVECKNYRRGLNEFISNRDAQMVVDKLLSREEFFEGFSVKYKRGEDTKELVGLFWADAQAKRNYVAFGDVVSFDATFRSNRYNMVLIPFTGIDNHNRCVIFAAALLANESAIKYTWLLKKFKKVFVKLLKVVVTDQDPAMKIAIEEILPNTRHRLCMWHIMAKVTTKVGTSLCSDTNFKRHLCDIVWTDKIEADVFDEH
ncbi:FAR1 DNA binding domain, zinc finger, SWIM-type, MULE transposase domain containing protein [Tanacetum coccineum]